MPELPWPDERIQAGIRETLTRACADGGVRRLAMCWRTEAVDPLAIFAAEVDLDGFYWEKPETDFSLVGLGEAALIETFGGERFERAAGASRALFESLDVVDLDREPDRAEPTIESPLPFLVGGFGFHDAAPDATSDWAPFGAGRLVLPELLVLRRADSTYCCLSLAVSPGEDLQALGRRCREALEWGLGHLSSGPICAGSWRGDSSHGHSHDSVSLASDLDRGPEYRVRSDRSHARYCAQVDLALSDIAAGKLSKVVLARSLDVAYDGDFLLPRFLDSLRQTYPACVVLAVRRGEKCFVSATPERLVALSGGSVETAAVAGSAPRGRSPEEEQRLAHSLLESEKEQAEHAHVKRAIRSALEAVCGAMDGPPHPGLLRLEGIQHLETPLRGRLLPEYVGQCSVLDLVGRLHPTPAVGGTPGSTALDWLQRFEDLERGWYAGPVGYLDAQGNGEFRVALRSGLIQGGRARLYAGAGIVAGSRPEQELAETRLKLRALLAPLTEI